MHIEEQVPLKRYTTLHVGGPARYFVRAKSDADVLAALVFAGERQLPHFILGKGSNTLFPDSGFGGVIIHMEDRQLQVQGNHITAASGVFMRQFVSFAHAAGLTGAEELAGIPGTIGGAVRGNAGTWQTEMKDIVDTVEVLKSVEGQWQPATVTATECAFGYRDSIFKRQPWVILRAHLTLTPGDVAAGKARVAQDLTDRHTRQPYDAPSAGSIFKNPDRAAGIFSGKLIEAAGLKGTTQGGAKISPKHGNFIVNTGTATSADVLALVRLAQRTVAERFHVQLKPEIEIVKNT